MVVFHDKYKFCCSVIAVFVFAPGLWTFLWFVGFCYMTDAWRKTDVSDTTYVHPHGKGKDNIQASIAFSFFSILSWVICRHVFVCVSVCVCVQLGSLVYLDKSIFCNHKIGAFVFHQF